MDWVKVLSSIDWAGVSVVVVPLASLLAPVVSAAMTHRQEVKMWNLKHNIQRRDDMISAYIHSTSSFIETQAPVHKESYRSAFIELLLVAPEDVRKMMLELDTRIRQFVPFQKNVELVEQCKDLLTKIALSISSHARSR